MMMCGTVDWSDVCGRIDRSDDDMWEGGLEWGCVGGWIGVLMCGRVDQSDDDAWEGGLQ